MTIYAVGNPHRVRNFILTILGILLLLGLCSASAIVYGLGRLTLRSPIVVETAVPTSRPAVSVNPTLATPYPVTTPVVTAPQGVAEQSGSTVRLFIVNPNGTEQNQVRHPGVYVQTNVSNTPVNFVLDVPSGYIGIVGGFAIDNLSNGVYQALPPGSHNRTITNGFALIVRQTWAQDEWNFRLNEAKTYGWAMQNISSGPLQSNTSVSSPAVPAPTTQAPIVTTNQRQATGTTGTLRFPAGASVCGNRIVLDNGRSFTDACFHSAPAAGSVTNGVIYPWETEFKAANIDPK